MYNRGIEGFIIYQGRDEDIETDGSIGIQVKLQERVKSIRHMLHTHTYTHIHTHTYTHTHTHTHTTV